MNGGVFIHIGPPKTATTALQLALHDINLPWLHYGGVVQPRSMPGGDMARLLHAIASGTLAPNAPEALRLHDEIAAAVRGGRAVLVSEEMLLATQPNATFERKLRTLAAFLADMPVFPVLTVRDPVEAIPSYYQQLHRGLPPRLRRSFKAFCADARVRCYDYPYVLELLSGLGWHPAAVVPITELSRGTLPMQRLVAHPAAADIELRISVENRGRRDATEGRWLPEVTARQTLAKTGAGRLLEATGLRHTSLFRTLRALADRVPLRRAGYHRLSLPTDIAAHYREGFRRVLEAGRNEKNG